MTRTTIATSAAALLLALLQSTAVAQSSDHPHLHVNSRWKECSFQLDPSLTQSAWRQFTREAGLVAYFRPLANAQPMGRGQFEVSVLQYKTGIDDSDSAWNDTFVHPDSAHVLFEGTGLSFPGLTVRAGVTDKADVGVYATKNPNANYGFYGGQLQYALVNDTRTGWATAARASFVSMFGPEDLDFTVYGVDLLASKTNALNARWASVSPYAGVSTYMGTSHEKTAAVNLRDEHVIGVQGMVGIVADISVTRLAAEYNFARVPSFSLKIGFGR